LLRDEDLRKKLGRQGRQYVLENCDWLKNSETICQICQNEVNRNGKEKVEYP